MFIKIEIDNKFCERRGATEARTEMHARARKWMWIEYVIKCHAMQFYLQRCELWVSIVFTCIVMLINIVDLYSFRFYERDFVLLFMNSFMRGCRVCFLVPLRWFERHTSSQCKWIVSMLVFSFYDVFKLLPILRELSIFVGSLSLTFAFHQTQWHIHTQ